MKLVRPMSDGQRNTLYFAGIGLAAFGMLLVILAVAGAVLRGGAAAGLTTLVWRAAGGMSLTAIGLAVLTVSSRGMPGSAIDMESEFTDDPKSRRPADDEVADPFAGTLSDESATAVRERPAGDPATLVCHWCHAANDDQARYCDQCGMRF